MTSPVPKRVWSAALRHAAAILAAGVAISTALGGCVSMPSNDHIGDPVTYAGRQATPGAADPDAAAQVVKALAGEPQLVSVTATHTASGLDVVVTLTRNDDGVQDAWLADLAVGAFAERSRSDETVVNELISSATAVGPDKQGKRTTSSLGIGAVRLGQVFGSPDDSALKARVTEVAASHGLRIADLRILHPLESALSVAFVVPDGVTVDWTLDALRASLAGTPPELEGVFIELRDAHGRPLLQSGVAYRTGEGGLWFATGQDTRFGALHGGTPIGVDLRPSGDQHN